MDLEGLARVKRTWMPGDGMLTLGICSRNVGGGSIGGGARGFLSTDMARKDWDGARALGLPITLHTSGPSPIKALEDAGLLGPDVQLVHPLLTTPEERAILKTRGVSYSIAPVPESRRASNLGVVQLGELLEAGVKVSLSTDHTSNYKCDPFGAMRVLFALHQHRLHNKPPVSLKRLVQLATLDGAVDLGLADRTGSLTPGQARRCHPGAHHRRQHDAGRRPLRDADLARRAGRMSTPSSWTAGSCAGRASSPRSTTARPCTRRAKPRRPSAPGRSGRREAVRAVSASSRPSEPNPWLGSREPGSSNPRKAVIAGLDPAIHLLRKTVLRSGWTRGSSPRVTPENG